MRVAQSKGTLAEGGGLWSPCRLCSGRGFDRVYRACVDRRGGTPGAFDIVRCRTCGLMRTEPYPYPRQAPGRVLTVALTPGPTASDHVGGDPPGAGPVQSMPWLGRGRASPARERGVTKGRGEGGPTTGMRAWARAVAWAPYRLRYGPVDAWPRPWPGAQRALDLGCGDGALLARLAGLGWDVWGIEPDPNAAAAAERAVGLPGRIMRGPAEDASYPTGFFDLITLTHSLEHLDDPVLVLSRARRWLQPGGLLRVQVPNIAGIEARLFGRLWHGLDVPRHRHHFSPATLALLLHRSGFLVRRCQPEAQAALLAGSLTAVVQTATGRSLSARTARLLYLLTVPVASTLAAFGLGGSIDVTAVPRP